MKRSVTLRGETFAFADLRDLMARANEPKAGDRLAGIAASSERERVAAKMALAEVPLHAFLDEPLIEDDVTALVVSSLDQQAFALLRSLTVGELRELVLAPSFASEWERGLKSALTPEMVAGVARIMSARDLMTAAAPLRAVTQCRNTMGDRGVLGVRVQPNHPTDDIAGVLLSALDGLLFGCGDAVIGVNPAGDSIENVIALEHALHDLISAVGAPTQSCVLAHFTTQLAALERGAPVDLLFQSIGGTEATNAGFGVTLQALAEGREAVLASHSGRDEFIGDNVMYFETGQGTALSVDGHGGIDQLTCEARAYGVARTFDPFLVNSVVGFIGPEYLANEREIMRAGLEDHFMGKLLGLPMGIDICYTNHVEANQDTTDQLLVLLATAGCNFVMGVPGSDDVMLNYQSTSYHDAAGVRELVGARPAPEFEKWLEQTGIYEGGKLSELAATGPDSLLAFTNSLKELGL
jgi:ethanolamine ammonia-lyase large subunit